MMRRLVWLAIALLALAAPPAAAQTVRVTSGEHDGFTRLALVLPGAADWQVTRTEGGYRLRVAQDGLRWDLADVFRPLTRARLATVWADPATGALELGVTCACHALPFEPRPGIVVIDLRAGPAPAGSAFEQDAAGRTLAPLLARSEIRPRPRPRPRRDLVAAGAGPVPALQAPPPEAAPPEAPPALVMAAGQVGMPQDAAPGYDWLDLRRPAPAPPSPEPVARATTDDGQQAAPAAPAASGDAAAPEAGTAHAAPDGEDPASPTLAEAAMVVDPGAADLGSATAAPVGDSQVQPTPAAAPAGAQGPLPAVAAGDDPAAPDLRRDLVEELARAAAQGSIDLATAPPPAVDEPAAIVVPDNLRIGNGVLSPGDPGLTAAGAICTPDEALDLAAWGSDGTGAATLGAVRQAVLGEFDAPAPAAAAALVRHYLHLGFGAEARQAAAAFTPEAAERPLWDSLSRLLDGGTDPGGAVAGQTACDGQVALWAVLAQPALPPAHRRNDAAVLRAFSALPLHLRRHLGPPLADRYIAAGEGGPAAAILAAIARAPGDPGPAAALLRQDLAAAAGDVPDAGALTEIAATSGDPGVRATIDLIELAAAAGAVPTDLLLSAEALERAREGTAEAADLGAAIALARASQGDYAAAFTRVPPDAREALAVWRMLAARGPDGAILAHAVADPLPALPAADRLALANRLVQLGLAEPALAWIGPAPPDEPDAARLVRAAAELARGDARAALRALAGVGGDAAAALRQTAHDRIDSATPDPTAPEAARQRALWLVRDWSGLAGNGPEVWRAAAAAVTPPDPDPAAGPLASGQALVADSAAARGAVTALLEATAMPQTDASGAATP